MINNEQINSESAELESSIKPKLGYAHSWCLQILSSPALRVASFLSLMVGLGFLGLGMVALTTSGATAMATAATFGLATFFGGLGGFGFYYGHTENKQKIKEDGPASEVNGVGIPEL